MTVLPQVHSRPRRVDEHWEESGRRQHIRHAQMRDKVRRDKVLVEFVHDDVEQKGQVGEEGDRRHRTEDQRENGRGRRDVRRV